MSSIYLSQPRLEAMYLSGLESFSRPVLSLSFQDVLSSPVTSFAAFLWAFLRTLTSILCCGTQYCIQYSKRGRTSTKYKGRITSFDQMVMLCCGHSSKMHGLIWSKDILPLNTELCSTILSFYIHLIPEYLFLWGTSHIFARPDFLMRSPVAPTSTGWKSTDKHILI